MPIGLMKFVQPLTGHNRREMMGPIGALLWQLPSCARTACRQMLAPTRNPVLLSLDSRESWVTGPQNSWDLGFEVLRLSVSGELHHFVTLAHPKSPPSSNSSISRKKTYRRSPPTRFCQDERSDLHSRVSASPTAFGPSIPGAIRIARGGRSFWESSVAP